MSSETERITNEVLNRQPWDKFKGRLGKAYFEDADDHQRIADELRTTKAGSAGTGHAILEIPQ